MERTITRFIAIMLILLINYKCTFVKLEVFLFYGSLQLISLKQFEFPKHFDLEFIIPYWY